MICRRAAPAALILSLLSSVTAPAQPDAAREKRIQWWRQARFGMFIHWGLYAQDGCFWKGQDGKTEHMMRHLQIPIAEYEKIANDFNPRQFDADEWVRIAKDAGMKYIVITSKHHDGFALFPSDVTEWDIADATPYKKDLLGPLVTAAHREGLKIGFYYSQAQDWNNPGGAKAHYNEGEGWDPAHKGDFDAYLENLAAPQVRELLTGYGRVALVWFDTPRLMTPERAQRFIQSVDRRSIGKTAGGSRKCMPWAAA